MRDEILTRNSGAESDPAPGRRPVVALVSYQCGPGAGSEFGVGWTWAEAASRVADVTLFTASSPFRPLVEATIAERAMPISVRWVDTPDWLARLFPGKVLGMARYCLWHAQTALALRRYERDFEVDAVHHVTWASDSLPSALIASKAPIRIWGPVGAARGRPLGFTGT